MGFFSAKNGFGVGSLLNSLTGARSAAETSQKYALQSMAINNAYQKEFAQNAHQWEMQDLEKAGLNPVLSAGGSGASASGGGTENASMQPSGIDPLSTAVNVWNGVEQAKNTGADTSKKNAEILNTESDTLNKKADTLLKQKQALQIDFQNARTEADRKAIMEKIRETQHNIDLIDAQTKLTNAQTSGTTLETGDEDELSFMGIPVYSHKHGRKTPSRFIR